jgi:cytoskeletal protein RodZ
MSCESIGAYLKNERETRKLSLEEVSSTTRIPRGTLKSLEENRFEELPSGVFVRGFIKAYASAVAIDADGVLARFDEERPEAPTPSPLSTVPRRRRWGGLVLVITTVAVFALIIATFALARRAPAQDDAIELSSALPCRVEATRAERSFCAPSITATPTESSPS